MVFFPVIPLTHFTLHNWNLWWRLIMKLFACNEWKISCLKYLLVTLQLFNLFTVSLCAFFAAIEHFTSVCKSSQHSLWLGYSEPNFYCYKFPKGLLFGILILHSWLIRMHMFRNVLGSSWWNLAIGGVTTAAKGKSGNHQTVKRNPGNCRIRKSLQLNFQLVNSRTLDFFQTCCDQTVHLNDWLYTICFTSERC